MKMFIGLLSVCAGVLLGSGILIATDAGLTGLSTTIMAAGIPQNLHLECGVVLAALAIAMHILGGGSLNPWKR